MYTTQHHPPPYPPGPPHLPYPTRPPAEPASHSNYLPTYGPGPTVMSHEEDGRRYSLVVAQSPQRARMCGFGDKDRRPITPPPCVRLVIVDISTGNELEADQIDTSFFVLTVDLWSSDGRQENNLIKTMNSAASIGTSEAGSFLSATTPLPLPVPSSGQPLVYHHPHPLYPGSIMPPPPPSPYAAYPPPYAIAPSPTSPYNAANPPVYYPQYTMMPPPPIPTHAPSHMQPAVGMFSRNLVGSLASSAFVLEDDHGKRGVCKCARSLPIQLRSQTPCHALADNRTTRVHPQRPQRPLGGHVPPETQLRAHRLEAQRAEHHDGRERQEQQQQQQQARGPEPECGAEGGARADPGLDLLRSLPGLLGEEVPRGVG